MHCAHVLCVRWSGVCVSVCRLKRECAPLPSLGSLTSQDEQNGMSSGYRFCVCVCVCVFSMAHLSY